MGALVTLLATKTRSLTSPARTSKSGNFLSLNERLSTTRLDYIGLDATETKSEVAVNIEKTSLNSRRIGGRTVIDAPIEDVWAILTDYDNLSEHVPNLIESKRVGGIVGSQRQGDGKYRCRLYQRGAQKIYGFQFGADVTMDMTENIPSVSERKINFKCVDSMFFSEFDGEWRVQSKGDGTTMLYYVVDVRPKGPVPVAALEWRIKEDVPTNMEAVKAAATNRSSGTKTPLVSTLSIGNTVVNTIPITNAVRSINAAKYAVEVGGGKVNDDIVSIRDTRQNLEWDDDETLAAYLPIS